jgi:hypothetical protein
LVFIKPTVITNLNSDRIIKQVNYWDGCCEYLCVYK